MKRNLILVLSLAAGGLAFSGYTRPVGVLLYLAIVIFVAFVVLRRRRDAG